METEQPNLSPNALAILEKRYLKDGEQPAALFRRVALNIAAGDKLYGANEDQRAATAETFYQMMARLEFLPNSPTLRGAGRRLQQLSGCFVVPIGDSLEEIFDALKAAAMIHKTGGGVGYSFSSLRPRGDVVSSTGNVAGGPVSFMEVFNAATGEITQGGVRMGANMAVLRVDHPDILEFIACKDDGKSLRNFNISVAVTDSFTRAVEKNGMYDLVNPRTGQAGKRLSAQKVFDAIVESAWRTGEPGVLFISTINRDNPTPQLGPIESCNPCGEQPLLPWESCNLGSINLAKMVLDDDVDWKKLGETVEHAVHFLDNVIDMNRYALPETEEITKENRKIGLGVMGFADMLVQLGVAYNSDAALEIAEQVMGLVSDVAERTSQHLAEGRGAFPNFVGSKRALSGHPPIRNAAMTSIAPNGTTGIIANCNGGIEPFYAMAYKRETLFNQGGATKTLVVVNEWFEKVAKERGFYSSELMERIAETGSIQHLDGIPDDVKRVFVTAHDITPEWHVKMQAAVQKHVDAAISKTINMASDATVEDIRQVYLLAHKLGCKGVTVYRDGCRDAQVLNVGTASTPNVTAIVKTRARVLHGKTYQTRTPLGTAYITVNENGEGHPFEVFINVGNAGSDTAAVAEALGRLISLTLRLPSPLPPSERMAKVVAQLSGIGGGRPLGLGAKRILSLPDAIAQVLAEHIGGVAMITVTDLCPDCGQATLVSQEGCRKCHSCGFSEC